MNSINHQLTLCALVSLAISTCHAVEVHRERSLYRDVIVTEKDDLRCMSFGRYTTIRQTCLSVKNPDKLVLEYTKAFLVGLYLNPTPQRALVIGMGGGVIPKILQHIYPNAAIDIVEIDPAVAKVAQSHFGFKANKNTRIFTEDGRYFVKKSLLSQVTYDHIFLDVFDENYIPEHLLTVEFLREVAKLLSANGVLSANTFSNSSIYDSESATYHAAIGDFYITRGVANQIITYRKPNLPSLAEMRVNASALNRQLIVYGVDMEALLTSTKRSEKKSSENARVFTDQFSPVNVINHR
jgi:spermidine synthase